MLDRTLQQLLIAVAVLAIQPEKPQQYPEWPRPPIQPPKIVPVTPPAPITTLPMGKLYVVLHNADPAQLLCSPDGIVSIKEYKDAVTIAGDFVDGGEETRDYKAKQIWLVKRLLPGSFELLKVPAGPVERRSLADGDQPVPPKPMPAKPVIALDGTSILLIFETTDLPKYTKEWKALPYSTRLYKYMDSVCMMHPSGKNHAWRIWDKDVDGYADSKEFGDALARPRKSVPWAIISSKNGNYEGPWPVDDLAMIELINKTVGGK